MQSSRTALYAGSFDPPTNGHLDILEKALRLFDHVVISIGVHPGKSPIFTAEERAELVRAAAHDRGLRSSSLSISFFSDLVVTEARRHEAGSLVRGLRDGTDLDYEMQMSGMNGALAPEIVTLFLPASPAVRPITATLVRQIAQMGGDVSAFVPAVVADALKHKLARP